jgi:hypothetical protein
MPKSSQTTERARWAIRIVLANKQQVFYQNIGDCYHNAVWWMHEHIPEIEAVLEEHINDEPRVILEDVFVSEDN